MFIWKTAFYSILLFAMGMNCLAQTYPPPTPGDFVIKDFKFQSGESLPELKLHYGTFGMPVKDKNGRVTNGVLVLHGTGRSIGNFKSLKATYLIA